MNSAADRILHLHGWAALALVFLLPALESSAFVGFIFPGEIAVLLGGVLAFQHQVSLPAVIAAAVLGAIIGDSAGYAIGRRFGRRLLESTVGRLVKREHLDRAEQYLARRGGRAVFFGRFTAALRVLVPGLAGMAHLEYRTFVIYNVAGGVIWATGFVLLGYAAGTSWRQVEHIAKRASLVLLLVVLLIAVVVVTARWAVRNQHRIQAFMGRQADRPLIAEVRQRFRRQLDFLIRRLHPEGALGLSLTVLLFLTGAAGWLFGVLVQDVLGRDGATLVDRPTLDFFVDHRTAWLTTAMKTVTILGSAGLLVPIVVIAGGIWWWRRGTPRPLLLLAAAWGGSSLLFRLVKLLAARPRPPLALAVHHFGGYSFPSGHATVAAATWGMLAVLAAAHRRSWPRKIALWSAAAFIALFTGLSRLYLGAHWLTDVLGGWALGALWMFVVIGTVRTVDGLRQSGRTLYSSSTGSPAATRPPSTTTA
jgi:undecaprenyl-diphosphatase